MPIRLRDTGGFVNGKQVDPHVASVAVMGDRRFGSAGKQLPSSSFTGQASWPGCAQSCQYKTWWSATGSVAVEILSDGARFMSSWRHFQKRLPHRSDDSQGLRFHFQVVWVVGAVTVTL
jgi:hypothetical protein